MIVIGLTGGVGSGKSVVASKLVEITGGESLITDEIGHLVMEPGTTCHEKIVEQFGTEIENMDGSFCKEKIAEIIFHDKEALKTMNAIVHPAVKEYISQFIAERKERKGFIVLESALLFETDCDKFCDEVWYVHVPEEVRIARLMESRGYTGEKSKAIIAKQLNEKEFMEKSDYVFYNHGTIEELSGVLKKVLDERFD